jgi:hypothetical protein
MDRMRYVVPRLTGAGNLECRAPAAQAQESPSTLVEVLLPAAAADLCQGPRGTDYAAWLECAILIP